MVMLWGMDTPWQPWVYAMVPSGKCHDFGNIDSVSIVIVIFKGIINALW